MRATRRAAVTAALLLLAAVAAAAQPLTCTAGHLKLDFVAPLGSEDPIAKCLTSIRLDVSATCQITLTPLTTGGNYIQGIWSGDDTKMYQRFVECPRTSTRPVQGKAGTGDKLEAIRYAVIRSLEGFSYGFDQYNEYNKPIDVPDLDFQPGRLVVKRMNAPNLHYAITESTVVDADFLQDTDIPITTVATCSNLYHPNPMYNADFLCKDNSVVWEPCPDGSYGVYIGDTPATTFKVCALCPAGTAGDGYGCTTCTAGTYSQIGQACAPCQPGTYSQAGSSNCLPCPTGTYSSNPGTKQCLECPEDSYAWIPGADACLRCINSVPERCVGGVCPSGVVTPGQTMSLPGTAIARAQQLASCKLDKASGYELKAFTKCSNWTAASPTLQFAFDVAGDCSIQISPISDGSCADPTDPRSSAGNPLYNPSVYPYGAVQMRGYYTWDPVSGTFVIRSLFDTGNGVVKSVMLAVDPIGGPLLRMAFFASTIDAQESENRIIEDKPDSNPIMCNATLELVGGQLVGSTDSDTDCPPGSYKDPSLVCPACPVGYTCSNNLLVPCPPNTFNAYLGFGGTCQVCPAGGGYTTYAAATQCDVAKTDLACDSDQTGSYQYDTATQACIKCPGGSYRDYADSSTTTCKLCPPGMYSAPGDLRCTSCPIGEYNQLDGLADQSDNTGHECVLCAEGSMALTTGPATIDSVPQIGSTFCDACPAGTYLPLYNQPCQTCPSDTYRTGDATPENNVCKPIPQGYRLKDDSHTEIELCPQGQVSYYSNNTRVPRNSPQACIACADLDGHLSLAGARLQYAHTYAPRKGMEACIACPGGTIPLSRQDFLGNYTDTCTACPNGRYRDAYGVSATCLPCGPGKEVGPSSKMDCMSCRSGTFMNAQRANLTTTDANFCAQCPKNTYRSTSGATTCLPCPKGTETLNTGNVECNPCAVGYYNNNPGQSCLPAPTGTYVNITGAFVSSPCPPGTWNDDVGQDTCSPCSPGSFSNTLGSKSCKTCPAGQYSRSQASFCLNCLAGFSSLPGAPGCTPCVAGLYAPKAQTAKCALCPKGFQCPTRGMNKEAPCPKGTFSNREGLRLCLPCPVNTISDGGGTAAAPKAVMACKKCPPGMNTRGLTGQSKCQLIRPQARRLLQASSRRAGGVARQASQASAL